MLFTELAVQGLKGFSAATRLAFPRGYVVLTPPAGAGAPPPLATLVRALLHAEPADAQLAAAQGARAALGLQGDDGQRYLVARAFGGGGGVHRFDPAQGKYVLLTDKPAELARVLQAAGVPARAAFEELLLLRAGQLPSRRAAGAAPGAAALDPALQARLAELEKELAVARETADLQFKLDGLETQAYALERVSRDDAALEAELEEAEVALRAVPSPESLGLAPDLFERCEAFPDQLARRDEALLALQGIRPHEAGLRRCMTCGGYHVGDAHGRPELPEIELPYVPPLWEDRRFLAAVGAGLLLLLVALFTREPLRYLAFLNVAAFGYAAACALQWVEQLQERERVRAQASLRTQRERAILQAWEAESRPVTQAMQVLGVETPHGVVEFFRARTPLLERWERARSALDARRAEPGRQAALDRRDELREERDRLEQQMSTLGYAREAVEVERDLAHVRAQLARAGGGSAPAPAGADAFGPLLQAALERLGTDAPGLQAAAGARAAQYVGALTQGRVRALELDRAGVRAVGGAGPQPVAALPPRDQDLCYLALRLTLAERASGARALPLVLEEPFAGFEDATLQLLGRMLKHLGGLTQVLHATGHPGFAQLAAARLAG